MGSRFWPFFGAKVAVGEGVAEKIKVGGGASGVTGSRDDGVRPALLWLKLRPGLFLP
ncbi:MAG: hypothetical protein U0401_13095 [Anaerolineae bacterium]